MASNPLPQALQDTEADVELGILDTEVHRSDASASRKGVQTSFRPTAGEETRKTKKAAKRAAKKKATIQLEQEPDLEGGENGAEPEPSPPSSSQRLSSTLRRSLFLDAAMTAMPFKEKAVQTPEHSETEPDSQHGSEPIENEAINKKNFDGTEEKNDEKTKEKSPNENTDGTQKNDKKEDQKKRDKEKKSTEDGKQTEDKGKQADEEKASSLKHGKFSTDGRTQEFVYIPTSDFLEDVGSRSSDIFDQVLRHWNLARPQLLIKFQSGFAHPKKLLSMTEIEKFESIVANSNEEPEVYKYFRHFQLCVQNKNRANPEEGEKMDEKTEALDLLNAFLFKSLSNLIEVIVRAAVRNRCWILVEGGPNSGLLLLKQAAEKCKESPVILVLDGVRRKRFAYAELNEKIKDYAGYSEVQNLDDLVKLEASSEPEDNKIVKKVIENMRKKMRIQGWKDFEKMKDEQMAKEEKGRRKTVNTVNTVETGGTGNTVQSKESQTLQEMRKWESKDQDKVEETRLQAALMTARLLRHAKPIDKPDMEPLKLTTSFWNLKEEKEGWELRSSESLDSGKVRWNHWHFRGGTHYIFTDLSPSELMTDCLAPSGSIFLGGGKSSKEELMRMLVNGEPVVCLDNTGRVTQDFVRCHKFLCDSLFREADENDKKPREEKAKMRFRKERSKGTHELRHTTNTDDKKKANTDFLKGDITRKTVFKQLTFDGFDGTLGREDMIGVIMEKLKEVEQFSKPELCELFLTYLRRGLQITKLCVVMDPLDPRECSGGHTEDRLSRCLSNFVILASNDTSDFADVEAVKAASRLEDQLMGAASVESWWAGSMTYMLLALNFFSLLLALARNSAGPQFLTGMPAPLLRWGLPGVSAASTFISGLVGRFRFMLRWSKARSAAAQLEAEIWKFRTRVCEYAVVGTREEEDGSSTPAGELGQAITRERKQDVTRSWFRANVNSIFNTAMEEMGTSSLHGHGFDKLPSNARSTKYPFLCWCCRRPKKPRQDERDPIMSGDGALSQNDLSRYGHIGVDEYYHQRTLSVFERMKKQAFWLTFLQGALESSVLLLGTFGVLLSTFDQTEIAMICLSLAANLQALERFHALSNRLDAANAGERDLICAWQDWSAMEPMQRRFQSSVSRLVLTTEGVNVALTIAATAGVRQSLPNSTKPN